ncbi:MAG: PHP domain-containing protein [Clostridiales Family XIII bacterium]|jgi:putative hydrolase|nr:PHP domain-containing protein [Clostridiales Family XIII bacterium]
MSLDQPKDSSTIEYMVNGRKYALLSDLHTHTVYSHGSGSVLDNVLSARSQGIMKIGIADHGPGHLGFGVPRKKLVEQKTEILRLRKLYPDMEIYFSVEADILGGGGLDIKPSEFDYFDYICAGWHYGAVNGLTPAGIAETIRNAARSSIDKATKGQIRANTRMLVKALENNPIKILTHPGDKAPADLLEVAAVCAKTDTLVEINTLHMSLTAEDIKMMMLADIRFVVSSDAHSPDRVGDFIAAVNLLIDAKVDMDRVVNIKVL